MNGLRPLPICLPPAGGEAFASWLDRVGADLEVPLMTLLVAVGLAPEPHFRMVPSGYGVSLTAEQLTDISHATGCSPDRIAATLLTAYDGLLFDLAAIDLQSDGGMRRLALYEWVYGHGSRLCPACLAESDGVWPLAWRLPWSFACVRHACLLVDACPGCHRHLRTARRKMTGPTTPSAVPTPTCCGNARDGHPGPAPRCGFDLTRIEAEPIAKWSGLLEAQAAIDSIISGRPAVSAGRGVSPVTFMRDLKAFVTLILQVGEPEDLGECPAGGVEAFTGVFDERTRIQRVDAGRGPARRFFVPIPRDPALMASVLPLAHHILTAPTDAELVDRVAWLADRIRSHGRKRLEEMPAQAHASEPLVAAFTSLAGPPAKFTSRAGIHLLAADEKRVCFDLNPAHVPALYWADRYERCFAELLEPMRERSGRRLCSITLVKACGGYSWKEAAMLLGYPPDVYRRLTSNLVSRLNEAGAAEHFWAALRTEATELALLEEHIDFGSRRRALEDLREIDLDGWVGLCVRSGVRRGGEPKRRSAVAWLWAELTGGDPWASPAGLQWEESRTRRAYEYFVMSQLPPMKDALLEYGEELRVAAANPLDPPANTPNRPESESEWGRLTARQSLSLPRRTQIENVA